MVPPLQAALRRRRIQITTIYEVFLDSAQLDLGRVECLGWLQVDDSRSASSHQPRSGCVLEHSSDHARLLTFDRRILDQALEGGPVLATYMEQKPFRLVGRSSSIALLFDMLNGCSGHRQCHPASCLWIRRLLDARSVHFLCHRTIGRSDSGIPGLSTTHHF